MHAGVIRGKPNEALSSSHCIALNDEKRIWKDVENSSGSFKLRLSLGKLYVFELCIIIYPCNKNQQNANFLH
jgi:hypothetical protein